MISPLLQSIARIILPPALLYAAYLLFRGHNFPGGGFVAGLMTAAAVILQYVSQERKDVDSRAPVDARVLIAVGLALAALTGIGAQLFGYPFLTSAFGHVEVPVLGHFESSTAFFFDLGVYFVVAGVTLTILLEIEE
ncbi:MAG: MnhB domain-containing protein [Candidatus Binatia bacterium]